MRTKMFKCKFNKTDKASKQPVAKQDYFSSSHRTYSCIHCRAHLANHDELISKLFQGNHGRAYLFNKVVNIGCKQAVQRELLTGLHAVADIYCDSCETTLGWKYEQAFVPSQKYKEGKYIIELVHMLKENEWDLTSYNTHELLKEEEINKRKEEYRIDNLRIGQNYIGTNSSRLIPRPIYSNNNSINQFNGLSKPVGTSTSIEENSTTNILKENRDYQQSNQDMEIDELITGHCPPIGSHCNERADCVELHLEALELVERSLEGLQLAQVAQYAKNLQILSTSPKNSLYSSPSQSNISSSSNSEINESSTIDETSQEISPSQCASVLIMSCSVVCHELVESPRSNGSTTNETDIILNKVDSEEPLEASRKLEDDSKDEKSEVDDENEVDTQEPAIDDETIFDADYEEEDFYNKNPVDTSSDETGDAEMNKDVKFNDPDFNDFDDVTNLNNNSSKHNPKEPTRQPSRQQQYFTNSTHIANGQEARKRSVLLTPVGCAINLERGVCIPFPTIEWAIKRAKRILRFSTPEDLDSRELSESSINAVGELNELTTRILAARFQMSWSEIAYELEQLDTSRTSLWRSCPAIYRSPPICRLLSRYRTHTGECNNLLGPHLGSRNMPFPRMLPPDYADGVGFPRRSSSSGGELPPVRLLALSLHPDIDNPSTDLSVLFMSWGQLVNHDLAMASGARGTTGHNYGCCKYRQRQRRDDRVCMPIQLAPDDPVYGQFGLRCLDFKRSIAGIRPGCSLGPRTQHNLITSYIDASFVYGSSPSTATSLRGQNRGLLEMWNYFGNRGLRPLLPPQTESPDEECIGRRGGQFCFRSGDQRTNQQIQLVVLHTVHSRQHNRLARALARLNPHWGDNRLYHEARHIHIAMVQHILLNEYLPALLGDKICAKYNLIESNSGSYWDRYDPSINPGVSQAFAAAAFRQGHSLVPSQVFRFNNLHEPRRVYLLRQLFRQPWPLYEPGAVDEFLLGLVNVPAQSYDPFVSTELSGHLLQTPDKPYGQDLTAINIQRGRDQGLASYNSFREWCDLGRAASFSELDKYMSNRTTYLLETLYESVDDIDLFTGGISEFPLEGAQVGPTFACIIGRQFERLRSGDRFWFENSQGPQAFSIEQLESIKQVTLARLICANSDNVITIQQMALKLPHPILNSQQLCSSLPDLNIMLWLEPQINRPG